MNQMMPNTKIKTNYYMSKILYESRPKLIKFLSDLRTQYRQLQRHFKMKYRHRREEKTKRNRIFIIINISMYINPYQFRYLYLYFVSRRK